MRSYNYNYVSASDFDSFDEESNIFKASDKIPYEEEGRERTILAYLGNSESKKNDSIIYYFLVFEKYLMSDKDASDIIYDQMYAVCSVEYSDGTFTFAHSTDVELH